MRGLFTAGVRLLGCYALYRSMTSLAAIIQALGIQSGASGKDQFLNPMLLTISTSVYAVLSLALAAFFLFKAEAVADWLRIPPQHTGAATLSEAQLTHVGLSLLSLYLVLTQGASALATIYWILAGNPLPPGYWVATDTVSKLVLTVLAAVVLIFSGRLSIWLTRGAESAT